MYALLVAIVVVSLGFAGYFMWSNDKLVKQQFTLDQQNEELDQRNRELGKLNITLDQQNTQLGDLNTTLDQQNKELSDLNVQLTSQTEEAIRQKNNADHQREIAEVQREEADAAAFRSKIGLAASQIDANIFNRAKTELEELAPRFGREGVMEELPWEYGRLVYMLDLSQQTIPTRFAVNCVAVSPDGQTVAVAGQASQVLLYTAGQEAPRKIPIDLQQVTDLAYLAGGRRLAIACAGDATQGRSPYASEIVVWDLDGEQPVRYPAPTGCWVLNFDARSLDSASPSIVAGLAIKAVVAGETSPEVSPQWEQSNQVLKTHQNRVTSVALSPDGQTLVSADSLGAVHLWRRQGDGKFELLRDEDPAELAVFTPNEGQTVHDVCFSPDGRLVATAGGGGNIQVWQHADLIDPAKRRTQLRPAGTLTGHTAAVLDIGFSADSRRLVSGSEDGTVRVWELTFSTVEPSLIAESSDAAERLEVRPIGLLRGHSGAVQSCAFLSPDGDRIVSGSVDGELRYWSLSGYREYLAIRSEDMPLMQYGCFSPDGQQVITAHWNGFNFGAALTWTLAFDGDKPSLDPAPPRVFEEGHTLFVAHADVDRRATGTELLTHALDGLACIWDAEQGRELLRLSGILPRLNYGFPLAVTSADGRWLLAAVSKSEGATDTTFDFACLWDRQQIRGEEVSPVARLADDDENVTAVAISRSGNLLFSGHDRGTGILWRRAADGTAEQAWKTEDLVTGITGAWFSPDESRLFCVSEYVVRQIDVASGKESTSLANRGRANIVAAAMSGDGSRLVVASVDGSLTLWDVSRPDAAGGEPLGTLTTDGRNIQAVDITDDGAFVVEVGAQIADGTNPDTTVRLLQVQSNGSLQEERTIKLPDQRPESVAFYAGDASKIVVAGGYEAVLWDLGQETPQRLRTFNAPAIPTSVRTSHDGQRLVTAHQDGAVRVWDAATRRSLWKIEPQAGGAAHFACFSPDDQHVYTAGDDGKVAIWQADTGQFIRDFCRHESGQAINQLAFSPDGKLLATASADGTVGVWDVQTGQPRLATRKRNGEVLCADFDPDGRWLAAGGTDQMVEVWDLRADEPGEPSEPAELLRGHSQQVGALAFSPDGDRLATGSADTTVKIWAVRLAKVVPEEDPTAPSLGTAPPAPIAENAGADAAAGVAEDPAENSDVAASPAGPVSSQDLPTLQTELKVEELMTIREHHDEVTSVEFSANGKNLLTVSRDGRAIVWPSSSKLPVNETPAEQPATGE